MISFFRAIGLPTSFKEAGLPSDKLEEMARKATEKGPLGSFAKMGTKDVVSVYKIAL